MAKRPITVDDLWALPRVGMPAVAPDGERFVVPVTSWPEGEDGSVTRLWLMPGKRALTPADVSSTQPAWSSDGTRLAFVRKHDDRNQVQVLPLGGGEAERVTDMEHGAFAPKWFPDGRRLAFVAGVHDGKKDVDVHVTEDRFYRFWDSWVSAERQPHLFVLDLDTRETRDLTPRVPIWAGADSPPAFDIRPDGREIVYSTIRSRPPHDPLIDGIFVVATTGKPVARDISPPDWATSFEPRYSPDGRRILFGAKKDWDDWSSPTRLVVYDRKTRRYAAVAPRWDLAPGSWSWDRRAVVCTADVDGRTGLYRIPLRGRPKELARGATFAGVKAEGGRLFTVLSSARAPGEVVSFAADGSGRKRHTRFTAPVMSKLATGRVRSVTFRGADDERVQMFLVDPPGVAPDKRLPLVHFIHGGPHATFSDTWHWRWNAQIAAARGYRVALVNFHGSAGFGHAFTRSIVGAWGDKSFTDIMRATDWLVEKGLADPKRMAAAGGSYGGYMASWIASQTDRFACIINHAGVCDLQGQFGCDIPQGWPNMAGGDPWSNPEGMDRFSPIRHARGFRSPMLILHGEKDYRVPYYQALALYNVYKARKRKARLVVYPGENHWILKPSTSRHWYGEFLGWLDRWLGKNKKKKGKTSGRGRVKRAKKAR